MRYIWCIGLFVLAISSSLCVSLHAETEPGLAGHWKLQGDCRDYSGNDNHGVNHGVDMQRGEFDGKSSFIEVPTSNLLQLGSDDFTFAAWIWTPPELDDVAGDVASMFDPQTRRGVNLTVNSSAGGYQSQGTDRQIHFGIDNAHTGDWIDCGRPNSTSNYVSNSLTVFDGHLYAATTDGQGADDWCHVYRYDGDQKWIDCGRVGTGKTTGVMPLIVHDGQLYAATSTYDWTRVKEGDYEPGRVYRYLGGTKWEDCGQPSDNRTLNSLASYRGHLYAGGGPETWGVFKLDADKKWQVSMEFSKEGPQRCFPHAMCRRNGRLYVAYPGVYEFDGAQWNFVGNPLAIEENPMLQSHSLTLHQGELLVGTWPEAKVAVYKGDKSWEEMGRVGVDGTEVNSLAVYNGKLYGGSLPRSEVCRYDGESTWSSIKRFYSPDGWIPGVPGAANRKEVNEWGRVTSLTVFDGKLFASTGSCTSSTQDAPLDVRGKVFSMEAGKMASSSKDLGAGWKHVAAVRSGGSLKLYVNGELAAESSSFDPADYDLNSGKPLLLGFGQTEYFDGKMNDVRLYRVALSDHRIAELAASQPAD